MRIEVHLGYFGMEATCLFGMKSVESSDEDDGGAFGQLSHESNVLMCLALAELFECCFSA
eukprot:1158825-Pelagomonas_calceolata.AAC.12